MHCPLKYLSDVLLIFHCGKFVVRSINESRDTFEFSTRVIYVQLEFYWVSGKKKRGILHSIVALENLLTSLLLSKETFIFEISAIGELSCEEEGKLNEDENEASIRRCTL
ncbi:hypothetical protein NPIL_426201 [Nephila pilipes]|uniref:Uncharacterized protein n=1 Tax=Nephila pilipes TaxID=299642 RepID=A0A8X6P5G2_NEPPI|nr:hypothetical protein NPIL_426201 [Nephila pilipes]